MWIMASKTANFSHHATPKDVEDVYLPYSLGCRGSLFTVTVERGAGPVNRKDKVGEQ